MALLDEHQMNAEIAVLKSQLEGIARQQHSDSSANAQQFAKLDAKFDLVTGLVRDLTRLQERAESHGSGLDKAHGAIGALVERFDNEHTRVTHCFESERLRVDRALQTIDSDIDERFRARAEAREQRRIEHDAVHAAIEKRHNTARGIIIGLGAANTLVMGLLIWAAMGLVARVDSNSDRLHQLELDYVVKTGKLPPAARAPRPAASGEAGHEAR